MWSEGLTGCCCVPGREVQLHPAHHLHRINAVLLRSSKTHAAWSLSWDACSTEVCVCAFPFFPDDHPDRLAHRNQLLLGGGRTQLLREESGVGSRQAEGDGISDDSSDYECVGCLMENLLLCPVQCILRVSYVDENDIWLVKKSQKKSLQDSKLLSVKPRKVNTQQGLSPPEVILSFPP